MSGPEQANHPGQPVKASRSAPIQRAISSHRDVQRSGGLGKVMRRPGESSEIIAATGELVGAYAPAAAGATHSMELQMQSEDIKLPVEIEALCREPIIHDGQRVVTTEQLARFYEAEVEHIHDNHRQNRERFVEGVHFVKLTGSELREFKNRPVHNRLVGAQARALTLWLERGAARHAKLLQTDKAWDVFGKLEDAYFDAAANPLPSAARLRPADAREVRLQMAQAMKLAQLGGLTGNQQIAAASRATRALTGFDYLAEMGVVRLTAPEPKQILVVRELGAALAKPMSAQDTNLWLTGHGYQTATRGWTGKIKYEATEKGEPFSEMCDVPLDTGRSQRQLVWRTSMVAVIDAKRAEAA